MFELNQNDFGQAAPLFDGVPHSTAIVFAVLEGHSPGRIFVDQCGSPSAALLYAAGAFGYVAGDAHNQPFCQALPELIATQVAQQAGEAAMVLFSFSPTWHTTLLDQLAPLGAVTIYRKAFHFDPALFSARRAQWTNLPPGVCLQAIDAAIAERYPAYRSLLEPASPRFGVCLLQGESLVSACTAVFVGGGEAEIDIFTEEAYRGHGLATLTARAFIDACLDRRLRPNWACWPGRKASWALAKKLGFVEQPDLPAIYWEISPSGRHL